MYRAIPTALVCTAFVCTAFVCTALRCRLDGLRIGQVHHDAEDFTRWLLGGPTELGQFASVRFGQARGDDVRELEWPSHVDSFRALAKKKATPERILDKDPSRVAFTPAWTRTTARASPRSDIATRISEMALDLACTMRTGPVSAVTALRCRHGWRMGSEARQPCLNLL
jgi:hypothetical protein